MLEYYKLKLVEVAQDRSLFRAELRRALQNLGSEKDRVDLRQWFKNRQKMEHP